MASLALPNLLGQGLLGVPLGGGGCGTRPEIREAGVEVSCGAGLVGPTASLGGALAGRGGGVGRLFGGGPGSREPAAWGRDG